MGTRSAGQQRRRRNAPVLEAPNDESDDEDSDEEDDDNKSTSSSSCHDDIDDDESISNNTELKIEDESITDVRSDDESIAGVSTESVDELGSEIDSENVVEGKRNRTTTTQPNIASFGGKKYHVNMLNIGHDAFTKLEQVKLGLYSTAVGICFNQMTAKKGIKLFGEKAVAAMYKGIQTAGRPGHTW